MRGEVYIGPVDFVPNDGSMIDPETALFAASWQAEDAPQPLDDVELEGADAAILWGRARAEIVLIRLGGRGDTFFSAGDVNPGDADEPIPEWPPPGPPPGGWWAPPPIPTLEEVEQVTADVRAGRLSPVDGQTWAFDRIGLRVELPDDVRHALLLLAALGPMGLRRR